MPYSQSHRLSEPAANELLGNRNNEITIIGFLRLFCIQVSSLYRIRIVYGRNRHRGCRVRICHNGVQAHKKLAGLAVALCSQYLQVSEGKCSFRRFLSCGFHSCLFALLLWLVRKLQSHIKVLVFLP